MTKMDTGELRKRILRALDEARTDATFKRSEKDATVRAYDQFLDTIAVPLLKQAQGILKAERQLFTVHAPAGGAKLAADKSPDTFLEFALDTVTVPPIVLVRTSLERGRHGVTVDEQPLAPGKPIASLTEEDVAAVLVTEIPKLVAR